MQRLIFWLRNLNGALTKAQKWYRRSKTGDRDNAKIATMACKATRD